MDKPTLKNSLKLFDHLGTVKSRSMFGGFGIFVNDTMFALVVQDQLHLRANDKSSTLFKEQGLKPYVYKKRGFPVTTKYFALSEDAWNDTDQILIQAEYALTSARDEKQAQAAAGPNRLKDLPNLRLGTERMLKKAGIESVEALCSAGSIQAFLAVQQSHTSNVSTDLLWALEGAICGKHWSVIPQNRKTELLQKLDHS